LCCGFDHSGSLRLARAPRATLRSGSSFSSLNICNIALSGAGQHLSEARRFLLATARADTVHGFSPSVSSHFFCTRLFHATSQSFAV
jgi:hypothetical protein